MAGSNHFRRLRRQRRQQGEVPTDGHGLASPAGGCRASSRNDRIRRKTFVELFSRRIAIRARENEFSKAKADYESTQSDRSSEK